MLRESHSSNATCLTMLRESHSAAGPAGAIIIIINIDIHLIFIVIIQRFALL